MSQTTNIVQWNCQGVSNKKNELLQMIQEKQPKVIALQETMIGPNMTLKIPHYNGYFKPGSFSGRYHGGVGLLIHESVPFFSEIRINSSLQAIAVQIQLQRKIAICSIYNSRSHTNSN